MAIEVTREFVDKRLLEQHHEITKFTFRVWKKHITNDRKTELLKSAILQRDYFRSLRAIMDENLTDKIIF